MRDEINEPRPLSEMTNAEASPTREFTNHKGNIPKSEHLKQHSIQINFCDVGCVITVGCKTFAFENNEKAMVALTDYVNDPEKSREFWTNQIIK